MRFLAPLLALFPFASEALAACDESIAGAIDANGDRLDDIDARATVACDAITNHGERISALEALAQQLAGGTPTGPTDGAPPWPAPAWAEWLRVPAGSGPWDGEAVDTQGRTLRIPDGEGFERVLVPLGWRPPAS